MLLGVWGFMWFNGICRYSEGMLLIHRDKRIIATVSANLGCIFIHTMGFGCYILQALYNDIPSLLSNLLHESSKRTTYPRQRRRLQHPYITKMNKVLLNLQPDSAFRVFISNHQHDVTENSGEGCEFHATTSLTKCNVLTNTSFVSNKSNKHFFSFGLVILANARVIHMTGKFNAWIIV